MKAIQLNLFILFLLMIFTISCNQVTKKELPIYNPSDFNPELVDKAMRNSTTYHTVADFELVNQNGRTITQDDYKDKIYD